MALFLWMKHKLKVIVSQHSRKRFKLNGRQAEHMSVHLSFYTRTTKYNSYRSYSTNLRFVLTILLSEFHLMYLKPERTLRSDFT